MVQLREGEAGKSVGMGRHGRAGKRAFGRGRYRLVVGTLHEKSLIVLSGLHDLRGSNVLLLSSTLETVDTTTILQLNVGTLLSQSLTLLFPALLGRESFLICGDQAIVLLVQSELTLLEAFTLLKRIRDVGLHTMDLSFNVSLDRVEFASHGVFAVALFLPFRFLGRSFLGLFLGDCTKLFGLFGEFSRSIFRLSNVLGELKNTLALTLVATSSIRQAIAKRVDLFFDRRDGGLVVLLNSFQAVALLLQLLVGRGNGILEGCRRRRWAQGLMSGRGGNRG